MSRLRESVLDVLGQRTQPDALDSGAGVSSVRRWRMPRLGEFIVEVGAESAVYDCVVCLRGRSGGLQPVHLPLAAGVRRRGAGADVHAVRQRHQLQGVHRPRHQPEQVLR